LAQTLNLKIRLAIGISNNSLQRNVEIDNPRYEYVKFLIAFE